MKAIHGGKAKNDRIDSQKIAVLLRGGMISVAYVYPPQMRSTRDLLRRRTYLVRKRAELLAHVQHTYGEGDPWSFGEQAESAMKQLLGGASLGTYFCARVVSVLIAQR
jgi:transposase